MKVADELRSRNEEQSRSGKARGTLAFLKSLRVMREVEDELSIRIELGQDREWAKWMIEKFSDGTET